MGTRGLTTKSRLLIILSLLSAFLLIGATTAWAGHADIEITIPVDTVVEADAESVTLLAQVDVPEDVVGHMCTVRAQSQNQTSSHPGNDLVVASGGSQVVLSDVEAQPGQIVETESLLELGQTITVSLVMGSHGIFSAGIDVVVECLAEETTTTSTTTPEVSPTQVTTSTTVEVLDTVVTTTVAPSTSIAVDVTEVDTLPYTGAEGSGLGLFALALVFTGALVVAASRRTDT